MSFEYLYAIKYYIIAFIIIFIASFFKRKGKKVSWCYRDIIFLFAGLTSLFILYVLFLPLLENFYLSGYLPSILSYNIYQIMSHMDMIIPILIFYLIKKDLQLKDLYVSIKNKKDILWGIGIGVLGSIWIIYRMFYLHKTHGNAWIGSVYELNLFPVFFIFYVIISSLLQEIYFRGILIPTFEERINTKFSVFLSALIFSLFHGIDFVAWILIIKFIIWGYIYSWPFVRRRTIIPSFIAHSIVNSSFYVKYLLAEGIIENPLL